MNQTTKRGSEEIRAASTTRKPPSRGPTQLQPWRQYMETRIEHHQDQHATDGRRMKSAGPFLGRWWNACSISSRDAGCPRIGGRSPRNCGCVGCLWMRQYIFRRRQLTIFIVADGGCQIEEGGFAGRRFCAQTEGLTEKQASGGGQTLAYSLGSESKDELKGDFSKGDLFK